MMKKIVIPLVVIALGVFLYFYYGLESEPAFELEEGFTYLYDGDSLAGWSVIGGESTFEAAGDEIIGRHGPGENTFLRTDRTFSDFTLKMQMRWEELGNSGVLFRASQRDDNGRAYGYQYELDHSERSWSGGIYDEARRGWLANLETNDEARAAVDQSGGWNDVVIEARGASLKTWINGVPAADIVDGLDLEGFVALQVHSGNKGIMRWRQIRIQEHAAIAQPGEGLDKSQDWQLENFSNSTVANGEITGTFAGEGGRLTARRQLDDAITRLTVPACDSPTIIRVRNSTGDGKGASYAQLSVYADRAEASLISPEGKTDFDAVDLNKAGRHTVTLAMLGQAITLTVNERDVARLVDTPLASRGQLIIEPAHCSDEFVVGDFAWLSLKEKSSEILFYQTLDNEPAPVLTPEQALADFRVAPGFEVELVAAEPLVEEPVAMAWDEYGRLYVVEMRGYMPDAYGTGRNDPVGQVVRLEDVDGDGRMDNSVVFLGKLVNPRAVAVVNEGVLIGEPPNLWLCELPTRESLCENRKSVGDYAPDVATANVEHLENRLLQGLDNWLYNSKSTRKMRLENGVMQTQESLFRGQWGISKDDYGRLFYNHNSTWLQADLFAAEDLVTTQDNTANNGLGVNLSEPSEVFSVRVNPGVNRAYLDGTLREDGRLHKTTGVSGLAVYRGDQFPESYRNDVFVPEVAGNVVAQFTVREQGMELEAQHQLYDDETWGQREFLGATDERFRPVDAMNGPDGALYVIDMYRGIVQDQHFLTDELREQIFLRQLDRPIGHGRIWRIRHTGGKATREMPQLAGASDQQLLAALTSPNGWLRDNAQRLLLGSEGKLAESLAQIARGEDSVAAIHALWTLQGREELTRELTMEVAARPDKQRQIQALRAGRELLDGADLLALYGQLDEAAEAVRMQLAFSMGDYAADRVVREKLLALLAGGMDSPYITQAVVRAVRGQEPVFLAELLDFDGSFATPDETTQHLLKTLAMNAYRTLRGDLDSEEPANPALQDLLAMVESRRGNDAWQQIAMLSGFEGLLLTTGFAPAALADVPPIFADGSISENDPLWDARLGGRRAFTWPGDELALGVTPLSPEQLQLMAMGESFYAKCGACHGSDGAGVTGLAPALANSPWVLGPPEWLARIVLQGMTGPVEIDGVIWNGVMPPHGHLAELDDQTLAGLMTYMRRAWGHKADPVSTDTVADIREGSTTRKKPWTVPELEAVPFDRGFSRFTGKYSVSFITMTIAEEADGLHMEVPMYGGGLLTQLSDNIFSGAAGGESVKVEFVIEEDGSVDAFLLHRGAEKITVKRKEG